APIANLTYDFGLEEPLTHEGINCDYCHSISRVQQTNSEFTVEHQFGLLKQGPLQNVKSPVHETRHNPLYRQSL
ncbi:MAG: hypothetical protein GWM98_07410, partial [Nitrospinaceae bacterium]|nr:hypothetical protein [Nitrospinaceae bacterium]NIR54361.1 hypothetical protein [Nitrospinaceae bacterium]NIS84779.1 hypothetical protein [Nitrospinaceae bacterium]NIT81580.1 hypothetical protein [Nitrospinaceae bacterium]NIU43864.1 hypothetical protein [Nitrospinaceae bacterium]